MDRHARTIVLAGLLAFLSGCRLDAPPPRSGEKTTAEFRDPRLVTVEGWEKDLMEPFISRDGKWLFFNNSNSPFVNTDLFYAERIDDLRFRFKGAVKGANTRFLDAVASMDESGRFYMTTTRDYERGLQTIFSGDFQDGVLTKLRVTPGNFAHLKPGWVTMDVEISADGNTFYYSDAFFTKGAVPKSSHLGVAVRDAKGAFLVPANAAELLKNVNSKDDLEYAPASSRDGLELFFTRLTMKGLHFRVMRARRKSLGEPFGEPEVVSAVAGGLVEAPTLAPDGKTLYYHKKDGSKHRLYRVVRD